LTDITAANRFNYFAVAASQSSTQSGGGWDDVDPNPPVTQVLEEKEGQRLSPGVVAQVSLEEEEENLGQDDIMPGSFEPAHREPSFPWTEVVSKNLHDFLTLLHVK